MNTPPGLRVSGLFAGVGGIELGLQKAGHHSSLLSEIDPAAQAVLTEQFEGASIVGDVRSIEELPECDLVSAGFPCQDLSQAGQTAGIKGKQSGLVAEVFRLIDASSSDLTWLLLENVSFMLSLDKGKAMNWLVDRLEERGFTWAYRVVDSRAFGLPQRRNRVVLLASRDADPRPVILNQDTEQAEPQTHDGQLGCGFYWTEGLRGLGWAVDAVPTLKGGSGLGIPSPPAIWRPMDGDVVIPGLTDAERLQGFPAGWTLPAEEAATIRKSKGARWKLIGNAVSVPMARWLGRRLTTEEPYIAKRDADNWPDRWPKAAWGSAGERRVVNVSPFPVRTKRPPLLDFVTGELTPLSARATAGFLNRLERGNLRYDNQFKKDVEVHLKRMTAEQDQVAA